MQLAEPILASWKAELHLEFERREGRSILAKRRHDGPLVVQKPLYPEGDAVCHAIVVHPPAGIAGGDELEIGVRAAEGAHALLTTPGAGKWYRSGGAWARQRIEFDARDGACIEWLPQETIVYDGALAGIRTEVRLAGSARFIGWRSPVLAAPVRASVSHAARAPWRLRYTGTASCCASSADASKAAARCSIRRQAWRASRSAARCSLRPRDWTARSHPVANCVRRAEKAQ